MTTQQDFEELLRLLEKNKVLYMIVGGYAVAYHGFPRFTKDIDIFFKNSASNIPRLKKALMEFGFPASKLPGKLFKTKGNIIQFGIIPVRVDLINDIEGVAFEDAEKNIQRGRYGKIEVNFIGKIDLIRNKKSAGRAQDTVDVEKLEKTNK